MEIKEITCNLEVKTSSIEIDEALADSGTTDHFLKEGAPAENVRPNPNPISIEMPNGKIEKSTHTCELRISDLPKELREEHIVPGLSH